MPPLSPAAIPTSSPLSSPRSFVTASASPPNLQYVPSTDLSSLAEVDAGATSTSGSDSPVRHRKAKRLPPELREHCRVYLEENLHQYTLNLLNSLLSARRDSLRYPAYCPPPSQLSLLNTIIVHPDFTTRPKESNWPEVAVESLVYLRSILTLFGPINAGFKESTRFTSGPAFSRASTPESDNTAENQNDDHRDADERGQVRLSGKHSDDSIWRRGQDFFTVVGWAFNCSVLYPSRWRYWKQWLDFMLDLLEKDLEERCRLDNESGQDGMPRLRESILAGYLSQRSGRSAGMAKWIMKAIFADGSKSASSLFQEVWYKEHRGMSHNAMNKRKREKVNIEKGEFGGWLDNDSVYSSQASEPPTPQKRRRNVGKMDRNEFQALEPTFMDSIPLRQRLFSALSYLCFHLPDAPLDLTDLYENLEATIKSLPLPIFTAFVTSSASALRVDSQITILQGIVELFMPSSALSPAKVDRARHEAGGISPAILERCFLPYAANTISAEDNAKVSVLLENLIQIIWCDGSEDFSASLGDAVLKGIDARAAKVKKKKTRGRGKDEDDSEAEARAVLEMSGERLVALADVIAELSAGDDEIEQDEES
ncbi:hypothetical protein F5X99DRAFT_410133 [Biscogniauxia marginata]|nr:hypothetical protein F5X99DRAFT_410133 [Biscogniauxia marginata]